MRNTLLPLSVMTLTLGALAIGCSGPSSESGGGTTNTSAGGNKAAGGQSGVGSGVGFGGSHVGVGGATVGQSNQTTGGNVAAGGKATSIGTTGPGTTISNAGTNANNTSPVAGGSTAAGGVTASGGKVTSGGAITSGGKSSGTAVAGAGKAAGGATSTGGKGSGGSTVSVAGKASTGGMVNSSTPPNTAGASPGCNPPATYPNLFVTLSGHTQEESDAKVSKMWSTLFDPKSSGTIYHDGPGSDESYVQDTYNNDVRTEGMSYGMMVAVQLDHQTEFDRLWTWVRNHMAQNCTSSGCTGEIAWSCSTSGGKNSTGGAPDGEEYMATALIFASKRWGDSSGKHAYSKEAQWVLDLIRTKYFNTTYHIVKFVSGSNNTDGSYVLPAFYQVWACFDTANASFWNSAVTAGREFFHNAIDSNGVIPDQSSFDGKSTVRGAGSDTIRCVMNIMMDWNFYAADTWQKDTYATKFGAYSKNASGTAQYPNALLGFGLPESSGKPFVDKIWSASVPNRDYWNGVLYSLALLHVSGTFKLWY